MNKTTTQMILSGETLGDENRIQSILADWGMDAAAIERMLDHHRALQATTVRSARDAALRQYPLSAPFRAPVISPGAHST